MNFKRQYAQARMVWNRGQSHLAAPRSVLELGLLVAIAIHAYELSLWFVTFTVLGSVLGVFAVGLWDVRSGFFKIETSVNNEHNPELLSIKKRVGRIK